MIRSAVGVLACTAIVDWSWRFYSLFGEYVTALLLLIVLASILAQPVESRFFNERESGNPGH